MYEVKKFLAFYTPALVWGPFHYSGLDLVSFLITVASAISGFFAATKWMASAQASKIIVEHELTNEEMRAQIKIQADYNANAAIYAALSATMVAVNQLLPVAVWYINMMNSH